MIFMCSEACAPRLGAQFVSGKTRCSTHRGAGTQRRVFTWGIPNGWILDGLYMFIIVYNCLYMFMSFPGFSNSNGWILDRQMFIYMFLNGGSPITENNLESKRFFFDDDLEKPGKSPFVRWFKGKIVILAKLHIAPVNNQEYQQWINREGPCYALLPAFWEHRQKTSRRTHLQESGAKHSKIQNNHNSKTIQGRAP